MQGPCTLPRASRICIEVLHKPTAGLHYSCFSFVGESVAPPKEYRKVLVQKGKKLLCLGQIFDTIKTTLSLFAGMFKHEHQASVR